MWFTLAILSYIFFAIAAFADKYILGSVIPSPKIYAFYTGILSLSVLLLIPIGALVSLEFFFVPDLPLIVLSLITGATIVAFLFSYYRGVQKFEISRISPAVGGIAPLFILVLVYILALVFPGLGLSRRILTNQEFLALVALVSGSVILTLHREKLATFQSFKISVGASFFLGLSLVLSKVVYNSFQSFWPGFVWIGMGQGLAAIFFLCSSEVRKEVLKKKKSFQKKLAFTFIFAKVSGALGSIFQNGAIFLAPAVFISIINALSGIQYVFLILFATLFFFKFPKVLKEEISKKVLFQKTVAIWLIVIGLMILSLS